jgi:hypothetical protein
VYTHDVEYTLQSIVFDFRGSPSKEGTKVGSPASYRSELCGVEGVFAGCF